MNGVSSMNKRQSWESNIKAKKFRKLVFTLLSRSLKELPQQRQRLFC
jgi:hypothetical protein